MNSAATPEPARPRRVSTRQRQTIFLEADETAYSEVLTRAFPGVRFWDYVPWEISSNKERPPETLPLCALTECQGDYVDIEFDPDWRPRWVWNEYHSEWKSQSSGQSLISGVIERHKTPIRGKAGRITLYSGRIYYRFDPDDKEEVAIARKALRLIDKVASNRDLMVLDIKTLEIRSPTCIGAPSVGHHARRWCLAEPDRLLDLSGHPKSTTAYRPKPE